MDLSSLGNIFFVDIKALEEYKNFKLFINSFILHFIVTFIRNISVVNTVLVKENLYTINLLFVYMSL